MWWLLAKRAALYCQDYGGTQRLINNKIVFYDVVCTDGASDEKLTNQKIKHELLEGLFVSVVKVHIRKKEDYKKAYELIIDTINKNGIYDRIKEYTI